MEEFLKVDKFLKNLRFVHHFHAWVDYLARGRHYDCLE
jgi:hypothetical protein